MKNRSSMKAKMRELASSLPPATVPVRAADTASQILDVAVRPYAHCCFPGHRRAIAVIHGSGVNAVFVLPAQALSRAVVRADCGAASAASPPSSSSSATGGSSWSCVHSPLKLLRRMLQNFTDPKDSTRVIDSTAIGRSSAWHTPSHLRSCG